MFVYLLCCMGGVAKVLALQILSHSAATLPLPMSSWDWPQQPPHEGTQQSRCHKLIILGIFAEFCVLSLKNPGGSKEMIKQRIHLDPQSPTVANLLMYSVATRIQENNCHNEFRNSFF